MAYVLQTDVKGTADSSAAEEYEDDFFWIWCVYSTVRYEAILDTVCCEYIFT